MNSLRLPDALRLIRRFIRDLALKFAMERLIVLLEEKWQADVHLVAEARIEKEA